MKFFENLMNQDLVEENSDMLKTIQETSLTESDTSKEGYLYLEGAQYPVLKLTEKSYSVLKGEQKIAIRRVIEK